MVVRYFIDRLGMVRPGALVGRKGRRAKDSLISKALWSGIEGLENREMMTAQILAPIGNISVQAGVGDTVINLANHFNDDFTQSVRINYRSLGTVEVLMYNTATPLTVANFLGYVNRGDYTNSIMHRTVGGFIVQGGGFRFDATKTVSGATGSKALSSPFPSVTAQAAVLNEPVASNIRGTIAMAKLGGNPNSATNQFFFNLGNNNDPLNPNSLDNQNGGFTAFGRVIGTGMTIVDQMGALTPFDFDTPNNTNAFGELPLRAYTATDLANNVSVTNNNAVIIDSVTVGAPSIPAIPTAAGQEARLALTASSSNPQVVSATIQGGTLRLQYSTTLIGVATITVRATDLLVENSPGTAAPVSSFEEITFQVQVGPSGPDLSPLITTSSLPTGPVITGASPSASMTVRVNNTGINPSAPFTFGDITVFARPVGAMNNLQDIQVHKATALNFSTIPVGSFRNFNLRFALPDTLQPENYTLVAHVDFDGSVTEGRDDNNTASTDIATPIVVQLGHRDVTATMGNDTVPAAIVSGTTLRGNVPVVVRNSGNLPLAAGSVMDIRVVARPVGGGADVTLATLNNQSVSGLRPNTTRTFTARLNVAGIPNGEYEIVAIIDDGNEIPETNSEGNAGPAEANNEATGGLFTVADPFVNLVGGFRTEGLPVGNIVSGAGTSFTPVVNVTNAGNSAAANDAAVTIEYLLLNLGNNTETLIATLADRSIARLAPGATRAISNRLTIPNGLPTGSYRLIARLLPGVTVGDTDATDDTATTGGQMQIAAGFRELRPAFTTSGLPSTSITSGGGARIQPTVQVFNDGNLTLPTGSNADLEFFIHNTTTNADTVVGRLENQSLANLAGGQSRTFRPTLTIPSGLSGTFTLNVRILDPQQPNIDANAANNSATATGQVTVTLGHVDLTATIGASTLPAAIVTGSNLTGSVAVKVMSTGNISIESPKTIDIRIIARPVGGGADVTLGELLNASVAAMAPNAMRNFNVRIQNNAVPQGQYVIGAVIDFNNDVRESDNAGVTAAAEANNTVIGIHQLAVAAPFRDLTVEFTNTTLPTGDVVSGSTTTIRPAVRIRNLGNVSMPAGSMVDIEFFIRNLADDAETVLGTLVNQSVASLGANGARIFNAARLPIPEGLDGHFVLGARIIPNIAAMDNDAANHEVTTAGQINVVRGFVDLTATLGTETLPGSLVLGDNLSGRTQVMVRNSGNLPVSATARITINLVARRDGQPDVVLATLANQSIARLQPNATRTFNLTANAAGLALGEHEIIGIVDVDNDVAETNAAGNAGPAEANNEATNDLAVIVANPFRDLAASIGATTLPVGLQQGVASVNRRVPITITNLGNVSLESTQKAMVEIFLHSLDQDGPADLLLTTMTNLNIGSLAPGASRAFTGIVTLPNNLANGQYTTLAIVTPVPAINEQTGLGQPSLDNNTAVDDAITTIQTNGLDLLPLIIEAALPNGLVVSGAGATADLTFRIRNGGNQAVPANRTIDVIIAARPQGAVDDSGDFTLLTINDVAIGGLFPLGSVERMVTVPFPVGLPSGDYNLAIKIDTSNDVLEPGDGENNNTALTNDQAAIEVLAGDVDLAAAFGAGVPATVLRGVNAQVPINVINNGNVAMPAGTTIDILLSARPAGGGDDVPVASLQNQSIAGLTPTGVAEFFASADTSMLDPDVDYNFVAQIDVSDAVAETNEMNNTAVNPQATDVARQTIDLTGMVTSTTLPTQTLQGTNTAASVQMTVTNGGTIAVPPGTLIDLTVVARRDGFADVILGSLLNQAANLPAGGSQNFVIQTNLQSNLPAGVYTIVALIDSGNDVTETNAAGDPAETNNEATAPQSLTVTAATIDLQPSFNNLQLPANPITAGAGDFIVVPLRLTNNGNSTIGSGISHSVRALARPITQPNGSQDVGLAITPVSVTGLQAGSSLTFTFVVQVPQGTAAGTYNLVLISDANNNIAESNEANNSVISETTFQVIVGLPDLTGSVTTGDLPAMINQGQTPTFDIPVTVTNSGAGAVAAGKSIDIQIRITDGVTTTNIALIQDLFAVPLNPAQSIVFTAESITLPGNLTPGTYQIEAVIDSSNHVNETNEGNNTVISIGTFEIVGLPDLTGSVTTGDLPDTINEGDTPTFDIPVTVTNAGSLAVQAGTDIEIQIRITDGVNITNLILLQETFAASLNPTQSTVFTATGITLPGDLPTGVYHIQAVIDVGGDVNELNEANNTVISSGTLVIGNVPELTGSVSIGDLPATIDEGDTPTFDIPVTVTNNGTAPVEAGTDIAIQIRITDGVTTTNIALIEHTLAQALNPTQSTILTAMGIILPGDLPTGIYHVEAVIDSTNQVNELDEDDNIVISAGSFIIGSVPDLTATVTTGNLAATVFEGQTPVFSIPVTVTNNGTGPVLAGSEMEILIRITDGVTTTNITLVQQTFAADLNPTESTVFTIMGLNLPGDLPTGTYHVEAVIDAGGDVAELIENNNTAASIGTFQIVAIPDLSGSVTTGDLPAVINEGEMPTFNIPVTVTNNGTAPVPAGTEITILVRITDGVGSGNLALIEETLVTPLNPNESRVFNALDIELFLLPVGTYQIEAFIDVDELVNESNEDNNIAISSGTLEVI